jgi:hypothetical protein
VALRNGWQPVPEAFLDVRGVGAIVARLVVEAADEMDYKQRKEMIRAQEVAVYNGLAKVFARAFKR